MMSILHSFLAQYFESSIVYNSSFAVDIPLWQSNFSKKRILYGWNCLVEWTRFIRAVLHILLAACSSPSTNTMHCVAYRPPIAVSLFLLALLVSYCKWHFCCCGQLWKYVGMGSFGTRLHGDWKAMGDTAKTSPDVPSTCAQNSILSVLIIHITRSCQIYVAINTPSIIPPMFCLTTSSDRWNYLGAAGNVFHIDNLQRNWCHCFSHLNKFGDGIQVTRVVRYCSERQS